MQFFDATACPRRHEVGLRPDFSRRRAPVPATVSWCALATRIVPIDDVAAIAAQ
jgi:hypothetical protein